MSEVDNGRCCLVGRGLISLLGVNWGLVVRVGRKMQGREGRAGGRYELSVQVKTWEKPQERTRDSESALDGMMGGVGSNSVYRRMVGWFQNVHQLTILHSHIHHIKIMEHGAWSMIAKISKISKISEL